MASSRLFVRSTFASGTPTIAELMTDPTGASNFYYIENLVSLIHVADYLAHEVIDVLALAGWSAGSPSGGNKAIWPQNHFWTKIVWFAKRLVGWRTLQ